MNLPELRKKYLGRTSQVCIFNREGILFDSCNTVFSIDSENGNPLSEVFPFSVGMENEIFNSTEESPFTIPGIMVTLAGKDRYLDFDFRSISYKGEFSLLAIINDVSELYGTLRDINQKKSEAMIENQLVIVQKESLQAHTQKLEQLNSELDRFAYVVSHDLKAPLRGIRNLIEFIKEDMGENLPEIVDENMGLLSKQVDKMSSLINGILEFSRAGRTQTQIEAVDTGKMIQEIIKNISLPENIQLKVQEGFPVFETYAMFLEQVFTNLISNAFKHHPGPTGLVELTYQEIEDGFYEFTVKDDGEGIAEEYHTRIFEMFERLKTRDPLESTGIGLAIVLKLVKETGGNAWVESTPSHGSTFKFTWPKEITS